MPLSGKSGNYAGMKTKRNLLLDFGQVLTADQDTSVYAPILERWQLDGAAFHAAWAAHRLDYDAGLFSAAEYWQLVLTESRAASAENENKNGKVELCLDDADLEWLKGIDMSAYAQPRAAVHGLAETCFSAGIDVGILSNMPAGHGESWLSFWPRLRACSVCLWSGEHKIIKPSRDIFVLFLERSGWNAEHTLFVDDNQANIETAAALGFATLHFTEEAANVRYAREWLGL